MQNLSHNIRTLRKAQGLTQEELAAALHVTRQAVSSWERGGSCPDFDTLKRIGEVLGAAPEQLLYGAAAGEAPKMRKVSYGLAMLVSLVLCFIAFFFLEYLGIALYFALLIPFCTCFIIDELRNGAYYRKQQQDETE